MSKMGYKQITNEEENKVATSASLLNSKNIQSIITQFNQSRKDENNKAGTIEGWDKVVQEIKDVLTKNDKESGKEAADAFNNSTLAQFLKNSFDNDEDFSLGEYNEDLTELIGNFTDSSQGCELLVGAFHSLGDGSNQLTNEQNALINAIRGTNFELAATMQQNPSLTMGQYTQSLRAARIESVKLKLAQIGMNLAISAVASLATTFVTTIVNWLIEEIDAAHISIEEATESIDELTQRFTEINSELQENQKIADESVDRYEKLSKGVDSFGNNISLTNDEFSEYNDLSNQIAEKFPTLVTGYTDTGNAILACRDNVELLNESLKKTNEQLQNEQVLNSQELMEDYYTLYKDGKQVNQRDELGDLLSLGREITKDDLEEFDVSKKGLRKMLEDAGIDDVSVFSGKKKLVKIFNENRGFLEKYYSKLSSEIEAANAEIRTQIIFPNLSYNSDYSGAYSNLSTAQQEMFQNLISDIDFVSMYKDCFGDDVGPMIDYLIDYVITPLGEAGNNAFKDSVAGMFDLDKKDMPYSVYIAKMSEYIKTVADQMSGLTAESEELEKYEQMFEDYKQWFKEYNTGEVSQETIAKIKKRSQELISEGLSSEGATTQQEYDAVIAKIAEIRNRILTDSGEIEQRLLKQYGIDDEAYNKTKNKTVSELTKNMKVTDRNSYQNKTAIEKAANEYIDQNLTQEDLALLEQNIPIGFTIESVSEVATKIQKVIDDAKKKINADIGFNVTDYSEEYEAAEEKISKYKSAYESAASGVMTDTEKLSLVMDMPELLPYINDTEKLKQKLEELSKSSVTEMLADLNQQLKEKEANPLVDQEEINNLKTYITLVEELGASVSEISVSDALSNVQTAYNTLDDLKDEIKDSGKVSADTLSSIADLSPELRDKTVDYINGNTDLDGLLAEVENYYETVKAENQDYLISVDNALVEHALETYGVDLENCQTYADAKRKILDSINSGTTSIQEDYAKERGFAGNITDFDLSTYYNFTDQVYTDAYRELANNVKGQSEAEKLAFINASIEEYNKTRNDENLSSKDIDTFKKNLEEFFVGNDSSDTDTDDDNHMEQFNDAMREIEHQWNMGLVDDDTYWQTYYENTEKYLANCEDCIDDYYSNIESYQDAMLSKLDSDFDKAVKQLDEDLEDGIINAEQYRSLYNQLNENTYGADSKYGNLEDVQDKYHDNQREVDRTLYSNEFDEKIEELDRQLERGEITNREYANAYRKIWEQYYKDKQEFRDEDYEAERAVVQATQDAIQYQIDGIQSIIDQNSDVIQDQIDAIEENTSNIEDAYQKEIDKIQEQIDLLDDKADEEDRYLKIKEAEAELEKASQRTRKVYTSSGHVVYRQDEEAISEAQKNLDDAKKEDATAKLQEQIDALEKERDAAVEANNKKTAALEKEQQEMNEPLEKLKEILEANLAAQYTLDPEFIKQLLQTTDSKEALELINGVQKAAGKDEITMEDMMKLAKTTAEENKPTQTQEQRENEQIQAVENAARKNEIKEAFESGDVKKFLELTKELSKEEFANLFSGNSTETTEEENAEIDNLDYVTDASVVELNQHLQSLINLINTYSVDTVPTINPDLTGMPVETAGGLGSTVNNISNMEGGTSSSVVFNGDIVISNSVGDSTSLAKELALNLPNAFMKQMFTNLK